jgi:hypothetical protein
MQGDRRVADHDHRYWYLAGTGRATAVLKVRNGIVHEVGIADKRLTRGRSSQLTLVTSFS